MQQRNHKSIISCWLAVFWGVASILSIAGCEDHPEAKAAKELRDQTAQAVRLSVEKKDFKGANDTVEGSLGRNRSRGLTRDAALLTSGNIALASGRQLQADLGLKTLPLSGNIDEFENVLRDSERLLIEKERIAMLLDADEKEVAELRQWLEGSDEKEGLKQQTEQVNAQMEKLVSQKTTVEQEKDKIQAILDEHQTSADNLIRQAELAEGDQRLELEKQAFSILQKRKEHYIKAQAAENKITALNDEIALVQVSVDGLAEASQETLQRIDEIINSETRTVLQKQLGEIEQAIDKNQQRLTKISNEIGSGLKLYRQDSDQACEKYESAISTFEQIKSGDAALTAMLSMADSAYLAAMTRANFVKVHMDITERLKGLMEFSDSQIISTVQNKLPAAAGVNADYKNAMIALFDQAVEAYETVFQRAASLGNDAQCSIAKSQLLAVHSKMQIADLIEEFDIATAADNAMKALIQKGTELGTCFTQSEAMRVIDNEGLNYQPSIPLNLAVFLEAKKQEFSGWKQLSIPEQEQAVDQNVAMIDEIIAEYGQEAALQLEPLKQEMLAAKERGFKQPTSGLNGGFGDPNTL